MRGVAPGVGLALGMAALLSIASEGGAQAPGHGLVLVAAATLHALRARRARTSPRG